MWMFLLRRDVFWTKPATFQKKKKLLLRRLWSMDRVFLCTLCFTSTVKWHSFCWRQIVCFRTMNSLFYDRVAFAIKSIARSTCKRSLRHDLSVLRFGSLPGDTVQWRCCENGQCYRGVCVTANSFYTNDLIPTNTSIKRTRFLYARDRKTDRDRDPRPRLSREGCSTSAFRNSVPENVF